MSNKEDKIFCRKDARKGCYSTTVKGKEVKFQDRELFVTANKDIIRALGSDPEIVEYTPDDDEDDTTQDGTGEDVGQRVNEEDDHGEADPGK